MMTLLEVIDRKHRQSVRIAGVLKHGDMLYAFLSGPDKHGNLKGYALKAGKFKCQNIPGVGFPAGRYKDTLILEHMKGDECRVFPAGTVFEEPLPGA